MSLTDNLISHWKLDEASGTRFDAHANNDLTDIQDTIGSTTGKLGDAANFVRANSEYLEITDNSSFNAMHNGDGFTVAAWIRTPSSFNSSFFYDIASKGGIAPNIEFLLLIKSSPHQFRFLTHVSASNYFTTSNVTLSTDTWYFVVAWFDPTTPNINITVNDGTVFSLTTASNVVESTEPFRIGSRNDPDNIHYMQGAVDSFSLWGRVLTAEEITQLYNSGDGLDLEDWVDITTTDNVLDSAFLISRRLSLKKLEFQYHRKTYIDSSKIRQPHLF